jgi:VIT1/CCC1 family predicted Fe2+/Mn2+ transporter
MVFAFIKQMLTPRKKQDGYAPIDFNKPTNDVEDGLNDTWYESKIKEKKPTHQGQASSTSINPRIISDATIGLSDGLTVPFALTAGLSALGDTKLVIYGGLAELIAGGISMGLGGYLGAKSETDAYHATLTNVRSIVATENGTAAEMARTTFDGFPFKRQTIDSLLASLVNEPADMVEFLMHFHHRLDAAEHTASREYICGLTISLGYIFGGLVPLLPYLVLSDIRKAFICSIIIMGLALFAFGWLKTALVGETSRRACLRGGLQMMILGGVAAGAAMGCVKAVGS